MLLFARTEVECGKGLLIPQPRCDLFCVIPLSLGVKLELKYIESDYFQCSGSAGKMNMVYLVNKHGIEYFQYTFQRTFPSAHPRQTFKIAKTAYYGRNSCCQRRFYTFPRWENKRVTEKDR